MSFLWIEFKFSIKVLFGFLISLGNFILECLSNPSGDPLMSRLFYVWSFFTIQLIWNSLKEQNFVRVKFRNFLWDSWNEKKVILATVHYITDSRYLIPGKSHFLNIFYREVRKSFWIWNLLHQAKHVAPILTSHQFSGSTLLSDSNEIRTHNP